MIVIGHRGAAAVSPENTIGSIERAFADGAGMVEIDVRLCQDQELVVVHDSSLQRTFGIDRPVSELTSNELIELGVPTLEQAWVASSGRIVIEVKGQWGTDIATRCIDVLMTFLESRDSTNAIVSSFDLTALRKIAGKIATGALTHEAFDVASALSVASTHEYLFLPLELTDSDSIARAHEQGLRIIPWTVNDVERIRKLCDQGADGIITDDPGAAVRALKR
ncbi:MAG: glycerophosphodiester phosphodiesterase [Actinomycetota bacterium]